MPREAWVTVILIAALGFVNYILLKLYGARGIEFTGFLGGLVNSTVTVTELANRLRAAGTQLSEATFRGIVLATLAMLVRNAAILGLLAPRALFSSAVPIALMLAGAGAAVYVHGRRGGATRRETQAPNAPPVNQPFSALQSPFSLTAALKFGIIFLALRIAGTLAQRMLGTAGFYAVSAAGGVVSSASAVAAAANLAASDTLPAHIAGIGALVASLVSALVNLPVVARLAGDRMLAQRLAWVLGGIVVLGMFGALIQVYLPIAHP